MLFYRRGREMLRFKFNMLFLVILWFFCIKYSFINIGILRESFVSWFLVDMSVVGFIYEI